MASRVTAVFIYTLYIATPVRADVSLNNSVAYYTGAISDEHNQAFFKAVKGKVVEKLSITSGGGEVEAGIMLGLWVFDRSVDVEVTQYCLSSCANYVFPAGNTKSIAEGAVVAWHGNYNHLEQTGLWRDEVVDRVQRLDENEYAASQHVREQVERLAKLERDFFARIGVDELLCWIGKQAPYNAPNYYFLNQRDMARFGVKQVETPPGYEKTDVSGFDDHIIYIKLAE